HLTDHFQPGRILNNLAESFPRHRAIGRDQQSNQVAAPPGRSGIARETVVPRLGVLRMVSSPPQAIARSPTPPSPRDRGEIISASLIPQPLSLTSSISTLSATWSVMWT